MQNTQDVQFTHSVLQQTMDAFISPVVIPASKLDADQYVAEDLDGVTENLFGSGNLNFLMMQAGQTNSLIQAENPFAIMGEGASFNGGLAAQTGFDSALSSTGNDFSYSGNETQGYLGDSGASVQQATGFNAGAAVAGGGVASISAAQSATSAVNIGFIPSVNGVNGGNGSEGQSFNGVNGTNGTNGSSGTNGINGQDGTGGGDTIINEFIDLTELIELGDVIINLDDINLGDIIVDLGDLTIIDLGDVTNIITTTITDITNILTNILDGGITLNLDAILSNVTDLDLDLILGDTVFNLIDQIIDLSPVTNLLDPILDLDGLILGEIHSGLSLFENGNHQHQPGDMDIGLGLNTVLGDLPLLNGVTDIILNPVEDILGDIDILADVGLDLFNTDNIDNANGDTDLSLDLGIGALDGTLLGGGIHVPLDLVENILGDIDLDIGAATNLLGNMAEGIVDNFAGGSDTPNLVSGVGDLVHNLAGDLLPDIGHGSPLANLGLDLFGNGETDNGAGDTDLALGNTGFDIPLDPLEQLTGDIDLDITDIGGLVADITGGIGNIGGDAQNPDLTLESDLGALNQIVPQLDIAQALDAIEPLTGDIDLASGVTLDLLGDNETDNAAGDSDIDLDLDLNVLGIDIVEIDFLDIPLDPIEHIVGDIDLNLNTALDLLNPQVNDGGVGDLLNNNGDGFLGWTENVLPDLGDLFGDSGSHGIENILPAPVGDIAEGLGGLLGGLHNDGGGLLGGGLFG